MKASWLSGVRVVLGVALALVAGVAIVACVVDPLTAKPVPTPVFDAKNIAAYGETAAGLPPDVVYGWDLIVEAGVARWRECAAVDQCGRVQRSRAAGEVVAVQKVGRAVVDGSEVDVVKISVSARPTYVVPYTRTRR